MESLGAEEILQGLKVSIKIQKGHEGADRAAQIPWRVNVDGS